MSIRQNFNFNKLDNYCKENNITLLEDYSSSQLTHKFIIKGKCIYNNCHNIFEKKFRNLTNSGAYCDKCIKIVSVDRIKNTFLQNYGVENILNLDFVKDKTNPNKFTNDKLINYCKDHNIILLCDYVNSKLTKKSVIKAKCQMDNCNLAVEKVFREIEKTGIYCKTCAQQNKLKKTKETCLEKYGVEHTRNAEHVKEKTKQTCLEKYGVEYSFQNEKVKNKIKETCIQRYGVENACQNKDVREKCKNTCLEKYGVEYISQTHYYKQKYNLTILTKYGVKHISQNEDIKQKKIETSLKKYGVEYPIQNPEVLDKNIKRCYKTKNYTFPSGKIIYVQGYEHLALDELINKEYISENDIVTGAKNVPTIWYIGTDGKNHRHYVDIFIPTQNRCIEVKSTWTAKINNHNIYLKQEAAKKLGYKYEIWIYNEKKNKIKCHV